MNAREVKLLAAALRSWRLICAKRYELHGRDYRELSLRHRIMVRR